MKIEEEEREWIEKKGYEKEYGERKMKRVIKKEVKDKMEESIMIGDIIEG